MYISIYTINISLSCGEPDHFKTLEVLEALGGLLGPLVREVDLGRTHIE